MFLTYAKHLFEALACLETQCIVHGDVKPQNTVFWRSISDGSFHFKLLDYGMARIISRDLASARVSQQSGTGHFRPPEIAAEWGAVHYCVHVCS